LELQPTIDDSELENYFRMQSSSATEMVRSARTFYFILKKGVLCSTPYKREILGMNSMLLRGIDVSEELSGI
jgi:hypothetical protein